MTSHQVSAPISRWGITALGRMTLFTLVLLLGAGPGGSPATAQNEPPDRSEDQTLLGLDEEIQDFKKEIIELNKDLFILEQELLFPASTQVVVFLSMDVGTFFKLDSVQLKINNKIVANHLYTRREVDALRRGGVQQLYMGNLPTGKHELVAVFTGLGPHDRDYRRGTTVSIDKDLAPAYIELQIKDDSRKQQPEFVVKTWQ